MPSSLNQSGQFTDCSSLTAVVHRKHLMADVIRHPDAQKLKELPELMVVQRSLTVLAPPHYNIHYFMHKISIFKDGIQAASACSPRLFIALNYNGRDDRSIDAVRTRKMPMTRVGNQITVAFPLIAKFKNKQNTYLTACCNVLFKEAKVARKSYKQRKRQTAVENSCSKLRQKGLHLCLQLWQN